MGISTNYYSKKIGLPEKILSPQFFQILILISPATEKVILTHA
jgi:hypothetical protein